VRFMRWRRVEDGPAATTGAGDTPNHQAKRVALTPARRLSILWPPGPSFLKPGRYRACAPRTAVTGPSAHWQMVKPVLHCGSRMRPPPSILLEILKWNLAIFTTKMTPSNKVDGISAIFSRLVQ